MAVACIWKAPFTGPPQVLAHLSGGGGTTSGADTVPRAITPDGATVVGGAIGADGHWKMVRWSTATLAVTALEDILPGVDCEAAMVSADGSVIIGGQAATAITGTAIAIETLARLTGGGAAGALLLDSGGGTGTGAEWGVGPTLGRRISDDGLVNSGDGAALPSYAATKWVNGVNVSLPGLGISGGDAAAASIGVSHDGSIVVGVTGDHVAGGTTTDQEACYWTGTTLRRLVYPANTQAPAFLGTVRSYFCNGDGSVIWGETSNTTKPNFQSWCYWDNVGTPAGDGVHYGTLHYLPDLPNTQTGAISRMQWVADDALVAVGYSPSGSSEIHAVKWVGTTAVDLGMFPSGNFTTAYGCNHDGSVVCGFGSDNFGASNPLWWDASNVMHNLPLLGDPDFAFGEGWGVSRDGSVIFGIIQFSGVEPTVAQTLTDAELYFNPTPGFVDLADVSNRRKFVSAAGCAQWLGLEGEQPMGQPSVYLSAEPGDAAIFAQNKGAAEDFAINGALGLAGSAPCCTSYVTTEAAGPGARPEWRLSVSDDGGRTWSLLVKPRGIGETGEYRARLRWLKMGQFRQRLFRLESSDPVRRNIVGFYVDLSQGMG